MRWRLLICLLLTASSVCGDDERNLRPPISQAELDERSNRLSQLELLDIILTREFEKAGNDPQKLKPLLDRLPPGILPGLPRPSITPQPPVNPFRPPPGSPAMPEPPRGATSPESPAYRPEMRRAPPRENRSPPALDPRLRNNPSVRNLLRFWEKNVGPLDNTPRLKTAFAGLLNNSMSGGSGGVGGDLFNSIIDPNTAIGREMAQWLESAANGASWKWTGLGSNTFKLNLPESNTTGGLTATSPPSFGTGGSPVIGIVVGVGAIGLLLVLIRRYGVRGLLGRTPRDSASIASRAIEPESVIDRDSLIQAFEALSLAGLGREVATWNHRTIAAAFATPVAAEAAGHYEAARYGPPSEPLTADTIVAARASLIALRGALAR